MDIGIPRETHRHEHRVGLNPFAVSRLVRQGHAVVVESRAGEAARFADPDYQRVGARIAYSAEELHQRSDMICRVQLMPDDEMKLLRPGTTVCAFQHLAVVPRAKVERLIELEATLIGYEVIRDERGALPVLLPFSEMAGQMAVHLAANLLQNDSGGRGVLLGNVPGVPPPTVVILGAGVVGRSAARQALGSGAHVIVLDSDLRKLGELNEALDHRPVTVLLGMGRLEQYTSIADVLVGAVHIPGERTPFVVTEEMVKAMKPGGVIIDVSVDQGGCVETSRPTTLDEPVFEAHGVLHYCVPNMTSNIARTASRALANAALPYVQELAARGLDATLLADPGLADGVYLYRGRVTSETVGRVLDVAPTPVRELLRGGGKP